jgi:hypothetical protein
LGIKSGVKGSKSNYFRVDLGVFYEV